MTSNASAMPARLACIAMLWAVQVSSADVGTAAPSPLPDLKGEVLTLQGFGTVGGIYNTTDEAEFIRDRSQPNGISGPGIGWEIDTRFGLQATWRPRGHIEAMLQLVTKQRYDGSWRPQISWAFLGYDFDPDLRLRVGRLGYDVYPNSDSRDVGYSYLWIRPPIDYFAQVHYSHFDGLDLALVRPLGAGVLKSKLLAGQLNETAATPQGSDYRMHGSTLWGGYLEYQTPSWQLRAGIGWMRLAHEYPLYEPVKEALRESGVDQAITLAEDLRMADRDFRFLSAGAIYEDGPLRSQIQLRSLWSQTWAYADNLAGYWSLGYRLGRWTPYIVYSRIKSDHDQPDTGLPDRPPFAALNEAVTQIAAATQADQDTFSLGARLDVREGLALKFQVDWVHNRDNPSLLWLSADPDWNGRATVLSASLDFIF